MTTPAVSFDPQSFQPLPQSGSVTFDTSTFQPLNSTPHVGPAGQPNPANVYQAAPDDNDAALAQRQAQSPILTGIGKGAESLLSPLAHPANTLLNLATKTGLIGAARDVYSDTFDRLIPTLNAYENSRSQGKGIADSLKAASDFATKHDAMRQALDQAIAAYKKNPTIEATNVITQISGQLALLVGGGVGATMEADAPEAVAATEETAQTAAKPGLISQIVKGRNVSQPQAQAALREAGSSVAPTAAPASLRESLTAPINAVETDAGALYRRIDEAAGTDFKSLGDKLQKVNQALRRTVDDAEEAKLLDRRANIESAIEDGKQTARDAGVDPKELDQADAQFKKMSALTDVQNKIFKSPDVINGNVAHGTPESVNVDNAIKALQKLQDNEEYGAPRLEQAFGQDGARQLLDRLYAAQRQGVTAMKLQRFAKLLGGGIAGVAVLKKVAPVAIKAATALTE